jgi:PAS domain S-box-containing protein
MSVKILAIDDSQDSLNLFSMILKQYVKGCQIFTAVTGPSGLKIARQELPDLILLDVKMPDMDGIEVCRRLKKDKTTQNIPVLMISGIAVKSKNRTEGLEVGAEGYLCKPFEIGELIAQVRSLLRIKQYQDRLLEREQGLETELEKHIRDLKNRETQLQNLFDNSPDPIFVEDFDGFVLDVNPAACELHKMGRDELVGKHFSELVPPEYREEAKREFSKWKTQQLKTYEGFSYSKDGEAVPVEVRASHTLFNGEDALLLHVRDITERKKNEEEIQRHREHLEELVAKRAGELHEAYQALSQSEERHRLMTENSYDLIAEFDADGKFLYANHQYKSMLGYEADELRENLFYEYIHEEDKAMVKERVNAALKNVGSAEKAVFRFRHAHDGHRVLEGAARVYEVSGKLHFVTSCRDITERQQILNALTESRESFHNIVEKSSDGILVVDNERVVVYANLAASQLLNKPVIELVGSKFSQGEPGPDGSRELVFERDGEKHVVEIQSTTTSWQGNPADLLMLRDITHRRKMEEEIVRVQKLQSVGVLAGGIAHDFNNILTGVIGNISFARILSDDPEELASVLQDAESAAMRARALTQQLLTFSKGGAPVRKVVSIGDQLKSSAGFVLTGSDCTCLFDVPEDLWSVRVDIDQFSQVIENLVINADQAMPRGGTIHVSAENCLLDKDDIQTLPLPTIGEFVKITIKDGGVGIPDDILDRIFDPYFTTKGQGNGLGLATVYSIIHNHDGLITVDSEIGEGTTFTIYLPALKKEAAKKEQVSATAPKKGSGHILVMDDEDVIRTFAKKALTALGYTVETAHDGRDAIEQFEAAKEHGNPFDAVILDLTIPGGMNGSQTLSHLLGTDPDIKAILSSGYADGPVMAKYREYGFSAVLSKPFTIKNLSETVHELLE